MDLCLKRLEAGPRTLDLPTLLNLGVWLSKMKEMKGQEYRVLEEVVKHMMAEGTEREILLAALKAALPEMLAHPWWTYLCCHSVAVTSTTVEPEAVVAPQAKSVVATSVEAPETTPLVSSSIQAPVVEEPAPSTSNDPVSSTEEVHATVQ